MQGIVKLSLPIFLFAVMVSSGCVNIDPQTLATANPMIQKFLDEHPNAEIVALHLSKVESMAFVETIRSECENPNFQAKEMYRVTISDPDSNLNAIIWVDWEEQIVECAIKYGTETEVSRPPKPGCESHVDNKCYSGQVYWYDSCGLLEGVKQYCKNGCENGVCKPEDSCSSHHELKCYDNDLYWYNSCGNMEEKKEHCEVGCEGNACLSETCTDSDEGLNYYEKGTASLGTLSKTDACYGKGASSAGVTEYYCENNEIKSKEYDCPGFLIDDTALYCKDGACVDEDADDTRECFDSDNGIKYHVKGTTSGKTSLSSEMGEYVDNCKDANTLEEYFCGQFFVNSWDYECPYGCEEGACTGAECVSHSTAKCYDDDLYWYDSCSVKEEKNMDCPSGCSDNSCVDLGGYCGDGTCSGNLVFLLDNEETITIDSISYSVSRATTTETHKNVMVDGEYEPVEDGNSYTINELSFYLSDIIGDNPYHIFVMEFDETENSRSCPSDCGLQLEMSCTDSDSNIDIEVKGTLTSHIGDVDDYCSDEISLNEWSCTDEDRIKVSGYSCTCLNGVCENKYYSDYELTDMVYDSLKSSWDSINMFEKGTLTTEDYSVMDYCQNDFTLMETTIATKTGSGALFGYATIFCPGNCIDGICQNQTDAICTDNDGGKNYYEKSTLTSNYATFTDYCENKVVLVEGVCGDSDDVSFAGEYYLEGKEYANYVKYVCPFGCYDGACIEEASSVTLNAKVRDLVFDEDESKEIIVDGSEYLLTLLGISDADKLVFQLDDYENTYSSAIDLYETEDNNYPAGFEVTVEDIVYSELPESVNMATISVGPEVSLETQTGTKEITIEDVTYSLSLIGVSDEDTAVVKINDSSRAVDLGDTRTWNGMYVTINSIDFNGLY